MSALTKVTIEKQPTGTWKLVREHATNGDTFLCDDLHDAFDTVLAAYRPDGEPRAWPSEQTGEADDGK